MLMSFRRVPGQTALSCTLYAVISNSVAATRLFGKRLVHVNFYSRIRRQSIWGRRCLTAFAIVFMGSCRSDELSHSAEPFDQRYVEHPRVPLALMEKYVVASRDVFLCLLWWRAYSKREYLSLERLLYNWSLLKPLTMSLISYNTDNYTTAPVRSFVQL